MRAAVCDDESLHRRNILALIQKNFPEILTFEFESGTELLSSDQSFDIIFLDIQMEDINGLSTAGELRRRGVNSFLIFITSHSEFVYESFKAKAFRFLNKPVDEDALIEAVDCIYEELRNSQRIVIKQKNGSVTLALKDIVLFEAFGEGTYVYDNKGRTYVCSVQLKEWERELRNRGFFQIHKSYIVSMYYVSSIENERVMLSEIGMELNVSRRRKTKFRNEYLDFVRKSAKVL